MGNSITINLDSELYNQLEKRAKKEFLDINELVEDIVRRSMISYSKTSKISDKNVDDTLVKIFSRSKKGRKRKSEKKHKEENPYYQTEFGVK